MRIIRRGAMIGATALLAGISLVGCAQPFEAEVGACLDSAGLAGEISELPTIDCAEEHDAEVFHKFSLPEGDFPGEAAVYEAAQAGCLEAFEPYVGTDYTESDLWITYLTPLEGSWSIDRDVVCILQSDDPVTGSMKGTGL